MRTGARDADASRAPGTFFFSSRFLISTNYLQVAYDDNTTNTNTTALPPCSLPLPPAQLTP